MEIFYILFVLNVFFFNPESSSEVVLEFDPVLKFHPSSYGTLHSHRQSMSCEDLLSRTFWSVTVLSVPG